MDKEEFCISSRGDLSEDDNSPTDSSEDSVEVKVKPIARPLKTSSYARLPHKFRKALTKGHFHQDIVSSKLSQKTNSVAHSNTEFRSSGPIARDRSPSPVAEGCSRAKLSVSTGSTTKEGQSEEVIPDSPLAHRVPLQIPLSPSPEKAIRIPKSTTTYRVSLQAPLSPGASARVRANRRKAAEPRKLCAEQDSSPAAPSEKRPCEDRNGSTDDATTDQRPNKYLRIHEGRVPENPFINHGTLLSPFVPAGGFSPILIPPWPPVPSRHPYAHLVTPPFGLLPAGIPPSAYPLIPIVPTQDAHTAHLLTTHPLSPTPSETSREQDQPISLVSRDKTPSSRSNRERLKDIPSQESSIPTSTKCETLPEISSTPHKSPSKMPSKFLSVESLLAIDSPPPSAAVPSIPVASSFVKEEREAVEENIQSLLQQPKQKQRNYKNMTRERRIEANARERTRVHTISAAFEKLRRSVPAYSHNQKLSKLSVLRIACSYILSLSRLSGEDYSLGETSPSFEECVDLTTKTIQVEGKAKKKKDDSV